MKTAILITVRLKSTRLPRKAIKPIQGKPMLTHLIDRLRLSRRADQIIVCTSPLPEDDPLAEIAEQESLPCFRGHPEDVLLRNTQAAERFGVDTVISCTGDNPFVDPEYIDRLADFHKAHNFDYSRVDGLPFGTFSYAVQRTAMSRACQIKDAVDTEVWGGYFTETGMFRCGVFRVEDPGIRWPELRLTVDTAEDFELVSKIFDTLYCPGEIFSLRQIVDLCRSRPELPAINSEVMQKPGLPIRIRPRLVKEERSAT